MHRPPSSQHTKTTSATNTPTKTTADLKYSWPSLQNKRNDSPQTSESLISSEKFYNLKQASDDEPDKRPQDKHSLPKDQPISTQNPSKFETKSSLFDALEIEYWKNSNKTNATDAKHLNSVEQNVPSTLFDSLTQIDSRTVSPPPKSSEWQSSSIKKRDLEENDQLQNVNNLEEDYVNTNSTGDEIIPGTPEKPPKRVSKLKQSKLVDIFRRD